jgi:hypothetical protein
MEKGSMSTPQELEALADRIDHEKLYNRAGLLAWQEWPQEQQDRMWAGIHLRRYAHDRGNMLEELKEGAQYIRGMRLERANRGTDARGCGDGEWHRACNAESDRLGAATPPGQPREWARLMHTAKRISDEVPRMVLLFQYERERGMPDTYKMCGLDPRPATQLTDNHLRCALGQQCRQCPHLAAIDRAESMTPEAKDEAKAWTCATHFLLESKPDVFFETILRDKGDDAFDAQMARSFADVYDDGSSA